MSVSINDAIEAASYIIANNPGVPSRELVKEAILAFLDAEQRRADTTGRLLRADTLRALIQEVRET